jgi:Flp pilus assembly protein TadD
MEVKGSDLRLLGELGLLAAGRGLGGEAEVIAAALAAYRPRSAIAGMVRGVAALGRGDHEGAIRALRHEALRAEPDSAEAKALLGLALERAGYRGAAEDVLAPLARTGGEGASALAQAVLHARRGQPD